jgi:hypothetical protein
MKPPEKSRRKTSAPAIDLAAASRASRVDPRLPHERDELAQKERAKPRGQTKRAYRDLSRGQVDTDCRNSAAEIIKKKSTTRLGARRKPDVR